MLSVGQIIFRLILITILSGLIGLEREFKHKPAGLRTNILVGLGSTLIMLTSIFAGVFNDGDPTKIASGVITGIGFIGAGLIIQGGDKVHGITTAATIWLVAGIGLAVGIGFYSAAIVATVIALVILYLLGSDNLRSIFKLNND